MQNTRRSRILTYAIAISLAVHVAAAIALHNVRRVEAAPEQRPARASIVHIATPPPPTPTPPPATPPPAPRAPERPAPAHQSHQLAAAPHVAGSSHGGPTETHASGGGTAGDGTVAATAMPSATPKPSCSQPNVVAHVVDAVPADMPEGLGDVQATVQVEVTLDESGRVAGTQIYKSSNDSRLDNAALVAAKRSTYAAAVVDCLPHSGSYLFVVDFQS